MSARAVRVRRVYETPEDADGTRVLVDRVWPRGLAKADAHVDDWAKDVAPSTALRKWYGHDPDRFAEFSRRYRNELASSEGQQALARLRGHDRRRALTLLTATKAVDISQAAVLAALLQDG